MKRCVFLSAFLAAVSAFALSEYELGPGVLSEFSLPRPFVIRSVWVLNPSAYTNANLRVDFGIDFDLRKQRPYRVIVPMTSVGTIEGIPTKLCVRNVAFPIWANRDYVVTKDNDSDPTSYSGSGVADGHAWTVRMWSDPVDWRFHVEMSLGEGNPQNIRDDYPMGTVPFDLNGRGAYRLWAYHSNGTKCQHFYEGDTADYVTVNKKIGTEYRQQVHHVDVLSLDFGTAEYSATDYVSVLIPSGIVMKVTKTDANAVVRMIVDDSMNGIGGSPSGGSSSGGGSSGGSGHADPGLPREIY